MTRQCEHCSHFMHTNSLKEGCKYLLPFIKRTGSKFMHSLFPIDTHKSAFVLEVTDAVSCPQQITRNDIMFIRK